MRDDPQVDWTLSEAPPAEELPSDVAPRDATRPPGPARRPLLRWPWLMLGALPVLGLLFTVVYSRLETLRIRREVEAVVARQEQARLDGDWAGLRATYGDDPSGWSEQRISRLRAGTGGVPMPIELPGFWQARQAGRVSQFQILAASL